MQSSGLESDKKRRSVLDSAKEGLSKIGYHGYKQIVGYETHRVERKWSYIDDGKGGKRKVLRLKQVGGKSTNSCLRACCLFPVTLFVAYFCLATMDFYMLMPWNAHIIVTPPASESVFHHEPGERIPIVHCDYCDECLPCRVCYDGKSDQYEAKFDRCPSHYSECSYPFGRLAHCAQKCPAILAIPDDVDCITTNMTYDINTYYNSIPELMHFRDPNLPLIDGDDDWGKSLPNSREGPNVYLPKGYTPDKEWPLLIFLCGRDSCSWLCMHQFGMRNLAHRYGFIFASPQATQQPPFGEPTVTTRFCTPGDMNLDASCAGSDDARFVWSIITQIKEMYSVSTVNILGWSNGAAMANTMACYYSEHIHSVVMLNNGNAHRPGVENHTTYSPVGCRPTHTIHMLYTHDPNDLIVPYSNAMYNLDAWGRINKCYVEVCPTFNRKLDILPRLHGTISFGGDFLAFIGLKQQRYVDEVDEYQFENCTSGGSSMLWVMQSYGSSTRWLFVGTPTKKGELNPSAVGGMGHFPAWGQTNDHGENQALGQRIYEHILSLPVQHKERVVYDEQTENLMTADNNTDFTSARRQLKGEDEADSMLDGLLDTLLGTLGDSLGLADSAAYSNANSAADTNTDMNAESQPGAQLVPRHRRELFADADLSHTSITECRIWAQYKGDKKFTLYIMLMVVSGVLTGVCCLSCCIVRAFIRHREESKLVKEFLANKRRTAMKSALAAKKWGVDPNAKPAPKQVGLAANGKPAPPAAKPPPGQYMGRRRRTGAGIVMPPPAANGTAMV